MTVQLRITTKTIFDESKRIDVLVEQCRIWVDRSARGSEHRRDKSQYETNVFGLVRTTQSVLPIMRKQNSGTIVNISFRLGRFGIAASSAYVSSKFAVEGLSESMYYELDPRPEGALLRVGGDRGGATGRAGLPRSSPDTDPAAVLHDRLTQELTVTDGGASLRLDLPFAQRGEASLEEDRARARRAGGRAQADDRAAGCAGRLQADVRARFEEGSLLVGFEDG